MGGTPRSCALVHEANKGRYGSQATAHVLSLEADFSVTLEARRVIRLIRKTKKARDITLASDWPSGASMISTVCKKLLESSITSALMPTASKKH